jgi:hypothetical protein
LIANPVLDEMERLIRRDPARRGLIASEESRGPLCPGHLAAAANHLATHGRRVVIVTGFYIPGASPPAAETDGPPGAALLGAALQSIGMSVQFVTDECCRNAVEVAVEAMSLPRSSVVSVGNDPEDVDRWFEQAVQDATQPPWTHLVAIERVGPSHTRDSVQAQGDADLRDFETMVPEADRNRCYNMRGVCLDDYTAPLHRLFESAHRSGIKTIGIGDGGNEIGMGSIPWSELRDRLQNPAVAKIPCRVPTDWTIIAGVSNWGGMALGAATTCALNQQSILQPWTADQQQTALERLVKGGPAVDGITRLPDATVDGLPFLTYIQPWEGIRRVAGLR